MLRKEIRQRLTKDYRFAVTKMQGEKQPARKLFYFSVFFSEAQRMLNWDWDTNLCLIYTVTQHVHTQINAAMQLNVQGAVLIDWVMIFDKLTKTSFELTSFFENMELTDEKEELYDILSRFAEIGYIVSGNGSYLVEKGAIKLS